MASQHRPDSQPVQNYDILNVIEQGRWGGYENTYKVAEYMVVFAVFA